jgi:hypothetical protein
MKPKLFFRFKKISSFLKEYWMLGLVFGFFSGLFCFPPNYINFNKVKGIVMTQYDTVTYVRVAGKRGGRFEDLMLQLSDSASYGTNGEKAKIRILKNELIGKEVEIIFTKVNDINVIRQLKVNESKIVDDNKYLVTFFTLNLIWFLIGGIAEGIRFWKKVIRIWRNAPEPVAKKTRNIPSDKLIITTEDSFHRYSNCPACGFKLKEMDKDCPDCGLNLS